MINAEDGGDGNTKLENLGGGGGGVCPLVKSSITSTGFIIHNIYQYLKIVPFVCFFLPLELSV